MNQSQAHERKIVKSNTLSLDEIFKGIKFKKYFKNQVGIDLSYVQNAHDYLISDKNKSLETLKDVFIFWKHMTPHFDNSFPCRYEEGVCLYCLRPREITNEEIDYILEKLEA